MVRAIVLAVTFSALIVATPSAQDVKYNGERVYADQKCSVCHAVAGRGNAKGSLDEVGSKLSADEIREWIADAKGMTIKTKAPRKPVMKAYALPKEDMDALVAYLSSLKKK